MRYLPLSFIAATALFSTSTLAQFVVEADTAVLQPQVARDAEGFSTCGIRAMVMVSAGEAIDMYDFSINVNAGLFAATTKAGKTVQSMAAVRAGKSPSPIASAPGPTNFWFAKELKGKPVTMLKTMPSDSEGYLLGIAPLVSAFEILTTLIHGERIHFAIRYAIEPSDRVVAFSEKLSAQEKTLMDSCILELIERMKKAESKKAPQNSKPKK